MTPPPYPGHPGWRDGRRAPGRSTDSGSRATTVELLVEGLRGLGSGQQVDAAICRRYSARRPEASSSRRSFPALGGDDQEVVPRPARDATADRVWHREPRAAVGPGAGAGLGSHWAGRAVWARLAFTLHLEHHAAELDLVAGLSGRACPVSSRWRFTNVPPGVSRSRMMRSVRSPRGRLPPRHPPGRVPLLIGQVEVRPRRRRVAEGSLPFSSKRRRPRARGRLRATSVVDRA